MKIPQILTLIQRNVMRMRTKTKMNMPGGKTGSMNNPEG